MIRRPFALLAVAALISGPAAAQVRIEFVLDSSREMEAELEDGQPRIDAVRQAVGSWIAEQPQETLAGLRLLAVGGTAETADSDACSDVRVLIEPGESDPEAWLAALDATQPAGSRALIQAVFATAENLASELETATLIVITSGENNCEVNGEAAAAALAGGIELRVIGIGLTDDAVERFTAVAPTRNTTDAESLLEALRSTADEIFADWVVLEVPSEVVSGHPFEVTWDGPAGEADFLSVADPGSEGGTYLNLYLAEAGSPAILAAPSSPGIYEVRYVDGRRGRVLRRQAFGVNHAAVVIEAPAVVRAGTRFEVTWTGPDASGDFIAIAQEGTPGRRHLDWIYTSLGSPTTMAAPVRPGDFEIRYVSGATKVVLEAVALTVER